MKEEGLPEMEGGWQGGGGSDEEEQFRSCRLQ